VSPRPVRTLVLLFCFALLIPAAAMAQRGQERVSLDFRDIELPDLIQTISELTGRNFLYDETVRGRATIISPEPMSLEQAYHLFLTVLNVKGFTVVPAGRVNKIVPLRDVREQTLPMAVRDREFPPEQHVTRVIPLQNIDASAVAATVLAPLVPKTSSVVAYPPSNTLIITDTSANIERLMRILREMDVPRAFDLLEVIQLQYAEAAEVAQILTQVLAGGPAATPARRTRTAAAVPGGPDGSRIIPYARTNHLIVMATEDDMLTIRQLVARLDQRTAQVHAGIYVYYLENADAETLAVTLNQIITGIRAQTAPPAARRAAPPAETPGQQTPALETVAITADRPTNALIINSTPEDYETLQGIIRQLDVRRRQVFVEALILELTMDATQRLGASLQGALGVGSDGVVFGSTLGSGAVTPDPTTLLSAIEGIRLGGISKLITVTGPDGREITVPALSALIDLSKTTGDVNILSAPRLLTSDNEEAEIIVGRNVPIITQRLTDTGGTGLAQSVAVERRDVALTLRFTPQITEGNMVRLNVLQEITNIAPTAVGNVDQVGPTLTKRLIRNTVLAEDGKTVVLGGLIDSNETERITKVPLLGDIPGLRWLFRNTTKTDVKTNLLVFITPTIIRDPTDLSNVTRQSRENMELFKAGQFTPVIHLDEEPEPIRYRLPESP
jgi:general secretion pathway protein D